MTRKLFVEIIDGIGHSIMKLTIRRHLLQYPYKDPTTQETSGEENEGVYSSGILSQFLISRKNKLKKK